MESRLNRIINIRPPQDVHQSNISTIILLQPIYSETGVWQKYEHLFSTRGGFRVLSLKYVLIHIEPVTPTACLF